MDAEIVITGLCSILNPFNENDRMGEPAVILVQTKDHHGRGPDHHIAFLGFDGRYVELSGGPRAVSIPETSFFYVPIDGYELLIEGNRPATPQPKDDSFRDFVAHRDEYWPEAVGQFDPAYVPAVGGRPLKTAVKTWMRFGEGKIGAARVSKVPWRFTNSSGLTLQRHFAEEVIYSGFPHSKDAVVVRLVDLESGKDSGVELTFRLRDASANSTLTLMLGNSMEEDLVDTLEREPTERVRRPYSNHFAFLNRTAGAEDGPIPTAINPPDDGGGGGGSGGACGPGSGNGRPRS